jgi:hypothetical protein
LRRLTGVVVAAAVIALALPSSGPAEGNGTANFGFSNGVTNAFRSQAYACLRQYRALGGIADQIFQSLLHAQLVVALQPPADGSHQSFAVLERFRPTGEYVIKIEWWPGQHGTYALDGAHQVPCAILLHEMQHAADFDSGVITAGRTESFDPSTLQNPAALRRALYIEGRGVRAENFYLWHHHLQQRRHYALFKLTTCVPRPETHGSIYVQGCYGTFILPSWVVWR